MIEIGPSRMLRLWVLLIWGVGALLIANQALTWVWAVQSLWTAAIAYWVMATCGLNARRIVLQSDAPELGLVMQGRSVPVTGVRPGVINRTLATFELETPESAFAVMATRDNISAEHHWRLRRLLLERV